MNEAPRSFALTLAPEGVWVHGTLVRLTRSERKLLTWLVAHAGEPQSAERLLREVWHYRAAIPSRTVATTVSRLRTKIEAHAGGARLIRTVPDGYVFDPPAPGLLREAGFVGRADEAATVRGWLRSGGWALLVTGPPGVGKSALVSEAVRSNAGGTPVCRIDLERSTLAEALEALEGAGPGVLWLDDADPVLAALGPTLARGPRRLLITCRYAVDLPEVDRLHLAPLDEDSVHHLMDHWLGSRFPGAAPSRRERARRVAEAAGSPARLRRILWAEEGSDAPPGLVRHHTEAEAMRWGLAGLPVAALGVLRQLAGVPAVDDAAAAALLGADEPRRLLALLRDRWLVEQVDGCWSVPDAVRSTLDPDASGFERLRRHVLHRFRASSRFELSAPELAAWHRIAWGLLGWAAERTTDEDELSDLLMGIDQHSEWSGVAFDSRPLLRRALEVLPEEEHHWWILRRLAKAEIRFGLVPDDVRVQGMFEASLALAERQTAEDVLLVRRSWAKAVAEAGYLQRAIGMARATAELARQHRDREYEGDARMIEGICHLSAGALDEASWCARTAFAVCPTPPTRWWNARSLGVVLAEMGKLEEARRVWLAAADALHDAGNSSYAAVLQVELSWTAVAEGAVPPEAERERLEALHAALVATRTAAEAGVASLYLAALELLCDRPEASLRWLQRATVHPDRTAEVRVVGAAAYTVLGLPVRWDALPAPPPESDPGLEQWIAAFVGAGAASPPLHPGRLSRVLGVVLARL